MTRDEFHALRDLPDKQVTADIYFKPLQTNSPNLTFDGIHVENSMGLDVIVNGTWKPSIPTIIYNFYIRGLGPICRVCVNGMIHQPAGRTHKHELRNEDDPRNNLPSVLPRLDMENLSPREVWSKMLEAAKIIHTGTFYDPT